MSQADAEPYAALRRICLSHLNEIVKRHGSFHTWRTPVEVTRYHTSACTDFVKFLEWEEMHKEESARIYA